MSEWSGALGSASLQPVYGDLKLAKAVGSSTAATPAYLAGVMGNVMEETAADGLTATKNILAGVVGKNDIQGTISSTYPAAGVIGEVGDKSSAEYAILAVMGGDTGSPTPVAMFGVDWQNSVVATEANFGLDLQGDGAHDSYMQPFYSSAPIRLSSRGMISGGNNPSKDGARIDNVVIALTNVAPVNGTSGTLAGVAGPGSLLIRSDTPTLYQNTNTLASPTWTSQT